jgi:hypothetical protein
LEVGSIAVVIPLLSLPHTHKRVADVFMFSQYGDELVGGGVISTISCFSPNLLLLLHSPHDPRTTEGLWRERKEEGLCYFKAK